MGLSYLYLLTSMFTFIDGSMNVPSIVAHLKVLGAIKYLYGDDSICMWDSRGCNEYMKYFV